LLDVAPEATMSDNQICWPSRNSFECLLKIKGGRNAASNSRLEFHKHIGMT
jgi:hypothetical protein